jgi:hypothetical protein
VSIRLNRGMESENIPKGFEKFKLFKDLINDIALLVKNLEQNLKNRLKNNASSSNPKGNLGKSSLWSGIKKFWPFKGVSEAYRPSLSEYIENKAKINKFTDEIVFEVVGKFNLIEQYENVSDIVDKFKKDVGDVFIKYSKVLQPEYDREVENLVKKTGVPDPISDKEVEDAHKSSSIRVDSNKKEIQDDKKSSNKSESLDLLIKALIENDVNIDNKQLVEKILGDHFNEDIWNQIKNYENLLDAIKLYSPKVIKGGRREWQEIVNKNKKEFISNWPMATKNSDELMNQLSILKANEMSDIEKLQYTLLVYEGSDEFDEFLKEYI